MDTDVKKWLVRTGSLIILLGFVLPVMTVSCAGLTAATNSVSMAQLAGMQNGGYSLLYLVPLGVIITLVLAIIPAGQKSTARQFLLGQLGGLIASLLGILLTGMSLLGQIQGLGQYGINVSLEYGIAILAIGYIVAGYGLVMQMKEIQGIKEDFLGSAPVYGDPFVQDYSPQPDWPPPSRIPPLPSGPVLQVVRGSLPRSQYELGDHFTIGRSATSLLCLDDDPSISRMHALIRFASGAWFIQDQDSRIGVLINGEKIRAARLTNGDMISIGNYTFRFIEQVLYR